MVTVTLTNGLVIGTGDLATAFAVAESMGLMVERVGGVPLVAAAEDVADEGAAERAEYERMVEDGEREQAAEAIARWEAEGADPLRWPFRPA